MPRLDHLLASLGYGSRRDARRLIGDGRVSAAGAAVRDASEHVQADDVRIDGAPLDHPAPLLLMLNKPAGRVCSHDDTEGPTVYGLIPERWRRRTPPVTSIGRLDKETTGLLVLTDRSDLVHRLTSPRHEVPKTYAATLDREVPPGAEERFSAGTLLLPGERQPCAPARLHRSGPCCATVVVTEGRYHQVRRMFAALGCTVTALHRTRVGPLELGDLPLGQWIELPLNRFDGA